MERLTFEWGETKARNNRKKHGVGFDEAKTVFDDPHARVMDDPDHSADEERAILIGYSSRNRLLFVSFAARGNAIRLISARKADPSEREFYEQTYD